MIKPLGNFLLVEKINQEVNRETTTEAGIVLTSTKEDRVDLIVAKGTVKEVGSKCKEVKKDDIVYFNYFAGNSLVIPGKDPLGKDDVECILVWEDDILAKEEDEPKN